MSFTVSIDGPGASLAMGRLADGLKNFPGAMKGAIRKGMKFAGEDVRREVVRKLADRYRAARKDIKGKTKVAVAAGGLGVTVSGEGRPLLLEKFKASPYQTSDRLGRARTGVRAAVLKSVRPRPVSGAFMAGGRIYKRTGPNARPINMVYGPTMIGWIADEREMKPLREHARDVLGRSMRRGAERELARIMHGGRGRK
jgi:hypothetical protein